MVILNFLAFLLENLKRSDIPLFALSFVKITIKVYNFLFFFFSQGDSEPSATTAEGINGDVDDGGDNTSKKHESDFGSTPLTVPEEGLFVVLY